MENYIFPNKKMPYTLHNFLAPANTSYCHNGEMNVIKSSRPLLQSSEFHFYLLSLWLYIRLN